VHYLNIFINGYKGYANYMWSELTFQYDYKPWYENYFYALILVSVLFFVAEAIAPWRAAQPKFRKDFWLDVFYMFFNFFLFSLIGYNAVSDVVVALFNDGLQAAFGITNLVAVEMKHLPYWQVLLIGFVVNDFVQWWTHRLLHRVPALWEFHKLHHSTTEMSFPAHLRYHFMETIVYKSIGYLPMAMLGIGLYDFFIVHIFALTWGHFNHANIKIPLGWLKYVFNNPQMHVWHHAKYLPKGEKINYGVNFGLTLSVWDYIFGTAYVPHDGRDIVLGFEGDETFPKDFVAQTKIVSR
jgi:sterol desaturase/sphingolipid hydroxylase (fatty acid hydroxylase superfamily)